jgi:RNA-binding protein
MDTPDGRDCDYGNGTAPGRTGKLSARQRAFLRSLANRIKATVWIGKEGLVPALIAQLDAQLTGRELVKVKLLETVDCDRRVVAGELSKATGSAVVQTLGHTILLFRAHPAKPVIDLPPPGAGGPTGGPDDTQGRDQPRPLPSEVVDPHREAARRHPLGA